MKRNDLFRVNNTIYRVVEVDIGRMLVIDCMNLTMPTWIPLREHSTITFEELLSATNRTIPSIEDLSQEQMKVMHQRFTMIAPLVTYITHSEMRNVALSDMAKRHNVTKQTIRKYLCLYLAYPNITVLAPNKKEPIKALFCL